MELSCLRITNFQSFGPETTEIKLDRLNFLIGPNGSGKTAVLQALCRLFAFDPNLRRILPTDFYVSGLESQEDLLTTERKFCIEADFTFPELKDDVGIHPTVPPCFSHMRLDIVGALPRIRFRLIATMDIDQEIDVSFDYVNDLDGDGEPLSVKSVPRVERNNIVVHYLPARRDPSQHITYTANSLLGRLIRSANWQNERETVKDLAGHINDALVANTAIKSLTDVLSGKWKKLHKGGFFTDPQVTFDRAEIESLLRHLTISFNPGHGVPDVDFSRLSDGQKSMLYLALITSTQQIGRAVISGENTSFDVDKLKPSIFTIVAMEEPENSLSPHYLGRIVDVLSEIGEQPDAQSIIATHAPSMLRRIEPESIRYLRLNKDRHTNITHIKLPEEQDEAYKYVRGAVRAFPELYFSSLVILGEGDSEEIVLSKVISASGFAYDDAAISIAPLGGRHVNHFWRLLTDLGIPFVTLLDLDLGRYQGGWGRVKNAVKQLKKYRGDSLLLDSDAIEAIPSWDSSYHLLEQEHTLKWIAYLEENDIFFSSPLDIDFAMLQKFPIAYDINCADLRLPESGMIKSVLGKSFKDSDQYSEDERKLFQNYHSIFQIGSKPSAHLNALSTVSNTDLIKDIPDAMKRLIGRVSSKMGEISE